MLAACGRSDEADAELASLGPTYPHHARAVFRVRLVQMLRSKDIAGAARWVEQGAADLPLSVREELLADVVRAAAAPQKAGAGEIERLKDELRRSPERRRWLDLVAPGVVAAFERSGQADDCPSVPVRVGVEGGAFLGVGSRVAAARDEGSEEEKEALAELEADEPRATAARRGTRR